MPTMSATTCACGSEMEYIGLNANTLHCPHCDEPCRVQEETKKPCELCTAFNHYWKRQVR